MTSTAWDTIGITPRRWQEEALPLALEAMNQGRAALVQAIMGAGKSIFMAGVIAGAKPEGKVIVTVPRLALVDQTWKTFSERLGEARVGRFDGRHKQYRQIMISSNASAIKLAQSYKDAGQEVCLWIADEAHGSEAEQIKAFSEIANPRQRLAVTATPRRASKKEHLSLWQEEIFRYSAQDALEDGVVVQPVVRHWDGGEATDLDDACYQMIERVVSDNEGPGIVDSRSIKDAVAFARRLKGGGIKAEALHCNLKPDEIQATLDRLEAGEISVVVHVAILAEGVDLPWLRWICLRRQVKSPIRFAQHVGRALRAYPGKDHALVLDPGDLFSHHSLSLEAILEGAPPPPKEDEELLPCLITGDLINKPTCARKRSPFCKMLECEFYQEPQDREQETVFAVAMNNYKSYLRQCTIKLGIAGMIEVVEYASDDWRDSEASDKQLTAIERLSPKLKGKNIPDGELAMLREIYAARYTLNKGFASDFLGTIVAILKARGWPKCLHHTQERKAA